MRNEVLQDHFRDVDDNPAGGNTYGQGFAIGWQNGPLGRGEDRQSPNGAFVEDIIYAAVGRLKFYQRSRFTCPENAAAIMHLEEALSILNARTKEREDRKVEGLHKV